MAGPIQTLWVQTLCPAFIEHECGVECDILRDIPLVAEVNVLLCLFPNPCLPLSALLGDSRVRNRGGLDAVQALLSSQ